MVSVAGIFISVQKTGEATGQIQQIAEQLSIQSMQRKAYSYILMALRCILAVRVMALWVVMIFLNQPLSMGNGPNL